MSFGASKYDPEYPSHFLPWYRFWYALKASARIVRVSKPITRILGFQYRRSRSLIEIDITYFCNLKCNNCNRSCSQAPTTLDMPIRTVAAFVDDSIASATMWTRIRVLGGEPTLHRRFFDIIDELLRYVIFNPECRLEVVTNGHGEKICTALRELPSAVHVDNSNKAGSYQPTFVPFNLAPQDDLRFRYSDFRNGCSIIRDCGIGLTPTGYYPCAIAGGIDRIMGSSSSRMGLPAEDDEMRDLLDRACRLCGRFKRDFVPNKLRPTIHNNPMSKSWVALYDNWRTAAKEHR